MLWMGSCQCLCLRQRSTPQPSGTIVVRTYTVTDIAGNTASLQRHIVILDRTPPVVTLLGPSSVQLLNVADWEDPGASAYDTLDGALAVMRQLDLDNVTSETQMMVATYRAVDFAGNVGVATRTVFIKDGGSDASMSTAVMVGVGGGAVVLLVVLVVLIVGVRRKRGKRGDKTRGAGSTPMVSNSRLVDNGGWFMARQCEACVLANLHYVRSLVALETLPSEYARPDQVLRSDGAQRRQTLFDRPGAGSASTNAPTRSYASPVRDLFHSPRDPAAGLTLSS